MQTNSSEPTLPPSEALQIEAVCSAFEQAWHSGQQPRLETYLGEIPDPARSTLLRALLSLELALRGRGGEPVTSATYEERFPDHVPLVRELFQHQVRTLEAGNATSSWPSWASWSTMAGSGKTAVPDRNLALPGYEVLGELGRGGMGVVYKARDRRLNRIVALKVILAGPHAGRDDIARFRNEAEAVARLQHPNIVQVREIGDHEQGQYLSLEFCCGGSLAGRLDGTPLQPAAAARLVQVLAGAVQAAHDAQVIHRDLKPANVLLTDRGEPKIGDFGLAKKLDELSGQTHTGQVMGTPSYMAPEQAAGKKDAGKPIDVYALGAILYQLMTGRPPFKGPTPLDTLAQVLADEPIAPSRLQPRTPRDLETICLKCLQKDPAGRYESASALAEDLRRFQAHEPITARPIGRLERVRRWCRRQPAQAAAVALGVVTLAAGITLAIGWLVLQEQSRAAELLRQEQAQTVSALGEAEKQRKLADDRGLLAAKYRRQAERLAAEIALDRGTVLCEQGEATEGLYWMAQGLQELPEDDIELERRIRLRLAAWHRQVHPLRMRWHPGETCCKSALSRAGGILLTGHADNSARSWDATTGKPFGPPLQHPAAITAVALSQDGRLALVATRDDCVRVWETATGKVAGPDFAFPTVDWARFSADGKRVVVVGGNSTAQVREIATGEPLGPPLLLRFGSTIIPSKKKLEISPNGRFVLLYGERDGELHDVVGGKRVAVLKQKGRTEVAAFSPDGRLVAAGTRDRLAQVWESATGKPVGPPLLHDGALQHLAFSPDGKTLAACAADRGYLWDVRTGKAVGVSLEDRGGMRELRFSPDGRLLLSKGVDQKLRFWDAKTGKRLGGTLDPYGPSVVAFCRDGRSLIALASNDTVHVWDISSCLPTSLVLRHQAAVNSVAFCSDDRTVLTASADRTAQFWDAESGEKLGPPLQHQGQVGAARFSPDGKLALTVADDGVVRFWETATRQPFGSPIHFEKRGNARFSPDGRLVFTNDHNGAARLWDVATGRPRGSPMQHPGRLVGIFSPDSRFVLTTCIDRTTRLWEVATCKQVGLPFHHADVVMCLAFSPDGRRILTGCRDGTAQLWEVPASLSRAEADPVPNGPRLPSFRHPFVVTCARFSPDGKMVLSGGGGGVLQLWDAATGKQVGSPLVHAQHVTYAVFGAGGDLILTASQTGSPSLWETRTGKMLGPPFPQSNRAVVVHTGFDTAAISPDGRNAVTAGDDGVARIWKLPVPVPGTRDDVALWVRVLAGLETSANGLPRIQDPAAWQRDHRCLEEIGGPLLPTDLLPDPPGAPKAARPRTDRDR